MTKAYFELKKREDVGKEIQLKRMKLGLTQRQLADQVPTLPKTLLSNLECGQKRFFWLETKQRVDALFKLLDIVPVWKELEKLRRKSPKTQAPRATHREPMPIAVPGYDDRPTSGLRAALGRLSAKVDEGQLTVEDAWVLLVHYAEKP